MGAEFSISYSQWMGCCLATGWPGNFQCILSMQSDGPASGCCALIRQSFICTCICLWRTCHLRRNSCLVLCKAFFAWSSKGLGISLLARSQSKINSSTFKEEGDWSDKHVWMSDTLLWHFWCTVLAEEQEYRNSSLVPFYLSIFIRLSSSVQQCPVSICLDPDANHFDAPFFGHLTHLCHIWQTLVTKVELSHAVTGSKLFQCSVPDAARLLIRFNEV